MRKLIFLLLALVALTSITDFAQNQYSYPTSGYVKENYFGDWISTGFWADGHKVGVWNASGWYETRNINNWTWTYNDIPTAATVTSVRIRFRAHDNAPTNFQITLHSIDHEWSSDYSYNFYNSFSTANQVYAADIATDANGYAYFDVTFSSGSDLCNAVNSAVQAGQYYYTLGFKITGSYQPDGWWTITDYSGNGYDDDPAIDLQINFSTTAQNYRFVNNIENTENYGSLVIKNNTSGVSNTISSGTTIGLDPKYIFSSRTNELPFIVNWNSSGYAEKHKNWIVNARDTNIITYDLKPDLNYISSKLTSKFNRTYTATIQNSLLDGGSGGVINLNDPWYYYSDAQNNWYQPNQFYEYSSPLSIQNSSSGSYGGIFLGQSPDQNNSTIPYYSVRTPLTQTINGYTGVFQNWGTTNASLQQVGSNPTGYDQKAVVFNSASATVTAYYKGLHISNDATAFSNNSQRKLIETKTGTTTWLHQVYASAGHVWIEHSSDGGSTWTLGNNSQPLDGTTGGKNPSIAYINDNTNNYNYIGVVWQQSYGSTYTICGKMLNQYAGSSNVPSPVTGVTTLFTEPTDAYSVNANPNLVLAAGAFGPYLITFERKSTSGSLQPGINWLVGKIIDSGTALDGPFGNVESNGIINGTNASTLNTQISRDQSADGGNQLGVNFIRQQGSPGTIYSHYLYLTKANGYWEYF